MWESKDKTRDDRTKEEKDWEASWDVDNLDIDWELDNVGEENNNLDGTWIMLHVSNRVVEELSSLARAKGKACSTKKHVF